jgi:hypothetical protein
MPPDKRSFGSIGRRSDGYDRRVMTVAGEHTLRGQGASAWPGTLALALQTDVDIEPSAFVDLAVDLAEVASLHARLIESRWIDEPAQVGSRAWFALTIPPSLSVLRPMIGDPRGELTLVEYQQGKRVRYVIDSPRVAGDIELVATSGKDVQSVAVTASLWAKARLARLATVAFARPAELVIARAALRTLARAEMRLHDASAADVTATRSR